MAEANFIFRQSKTKGSWNGWKVEIMTSIKVNYRGGESRLQAGVAVDYMLAVTEVDGEQVELYAEAEAIDGDEDANFDGLKAEILRQAIEAGVDADQLRF